MKKGGTEVDQNDFLNTILDSIADGVFTVDEDWNITSFNKAAERITGISRKDAIGQKCYEVFHASICQTSCALKKTIETGKEIIDLPIDIVNSRGERIPVKISTAVLRSKNGKIIGGVETFRDMSEIEELRKQLYDHYTYDSIVTRNHGMQQIIAMLPDIAESDCTVLIQGPSGSGKELLARAIHNLSPRSKGPFVPVNCNAIPETLLESELFGYVKGAFTGARNRKPGRFEAASGGTLFLDEIGDISPVVQVKLLRFLQNREFEPLGATEKKTADVRIIAASNKDLLTLVKENKFREDLYYRINVVKIDLPPLKDRKDDIPLLVDHIIKKLNAKTGKNVQKVSEEVMNVLLTYDFPGNVRELENILEHAFVLCRGSTIEKAHLPKEIASIKPEAFRVSPDETGDLLSSAEKAAIIAALEANRWHRGKTAQALGIDKSTLWRKMKKYNIVHGKK